jgi:hypothetical protein
MTYTTGEGRLGTHLPVTTIWIYNTCDRSLSSDGEWIHFSSLMALILTSSHYACFSKI